jgi:4-amino-4-deoxy-L-arabinose transferase-like glycosyltransferase
MDEIKKEEQIIEERKTKLLSWFSDKHNLILALMGIFVVITYIYFFFKLGNQPTWWDEGDYLSMAKIWAFNMPTPEWWGNLSLMRPPVIPFLWSILFRLGSGELFVRFLTELIPALVSIWIIYLLGKGMFNKNIGLIAAAFISFNWVFMFYSFRLLTDSPTLMFISLGLYFFWVKYEKPYIENKTENLLYLCLGVGFCLLGFMTRYASGVVIAGIAIYLLITRNVLAFKNKKLWIALFVGVLVLLPLFIYYYIGFGNIFPALGFYQGAESGAMSRGFSWEVINLRLPNFFGYSQAIDPAANLIVKLGFYIGYLSFLIGLVLLLEFLFSFDLIIKRENLSKNKLLFCFIGIILPLIYFIFGIRGIDERYLVSVCPLFILAAAYGLDFSIRKLQELIKVKNLYIFLIILLTAFVFFQQFYLATHFINDRYGSYGPIQEAGLWLKENVPAESKIVTASTVQILYYSERQTYVFWGNNSEYNGCFDVNGKMTNNETCLKGTESNFNAKVAELKPDYLIVHIFEPVFTPQWAYDYPQRYNLTFIKAFGNYGEGPALIIYKF